MKKILLILTVVLLFCPPLSAYQSEFLFDDAELLTETETEKLSDFLNRVSTRVGFPVMVVTIDNHQGNYKYDIGQYTDGIMLLISLEEREFNIDTIGYAHTAIDDNKLIYIEDVILDGLGRGDYYAAFSAYANKVNVLVSEYETTVGDSTEGSNVGQLLLISLGIGLVISFILVTIKKSGMTTVKSASCAADYVIRDSLNITRSSDRYLYKTVTRTRKAENKSSRGGSSSRGRRSGKF